MKNKMLLLGIPLLIIFIISCGKKEPQNKIIVMNNYTKEQTKKNIEVIYGDVKEIENVLDDISSIENHEKKALVVIDAGHQQKQNQEKEPLGPGSKQMKAKVSGGTCGTTTKIPEYQLTLELALQLEVELVKRGYEVIQTRNSHDVNISNSERAMIANNANADAFIRIHADGSNNKDANGATTICQTKNNPYNGVFYNNSKSLATHILDDLVKETGCKRRLVWETDTMSGINWCQVPVSIIEVGFMTNPREDQLLATDEYKEKIVLGIANGIDDYFNEKKVIEEIINGKP